MNNRYTFPIAFAVAVHASLMFGFHHPAVVREAPPPPPRSKTPPPDRPEIEIVPFEDTEDKVPPGGMINPEKSEPATREEPDPIPRDPVSLAISIPKTPAHVSDTALIDPRSRGVPGGDILGGIGGIGILPVGALDKTPHAQVQAAPDYPFAAKKDGIDGEVVVEFLVDETGRVSHPSIVRSTNSIFDEPSLRAVMRWRFEPGRRDGRVVRFRMAVPVVFHLNND